MKKLLCFFCTLSALAAEAQGPDWAKKDWENHATTEFWDAPPPPIVKPAGNWSTPPPSDATVLFDGSGLLAWQDLGDSSRCSWHLKDSVMTVKSMSGDIRTKQKFGDCQIHLEFKIWEGSKKAPRDDAGNSGVLIQERYEIQIFDSYQNEVPLYPNGQCAAVYKQTAPMFNACSKPGAWNSYDIFYTAPIFMPNGAVEKPAFVTLLHNGILVLNHFEIQGSTQYIGFPRYEPHGKAPLRLQEHHAPVSFRNIWIRNF